MLYIYSKEKKAKVKFTINLTEEEVKQFMGNDLFLDYPELDKNDYIIVKDEVFRYPTYDTVSNSIREMTREELIHEEIEVQLSPGEYIENKKLFTVPQPSLYHTWNVITRKWDIDMNGVKKIFRHKFRAILSEKIFGSFEYEEKKFQMREYDEINFIRVKMAMDIISESRDIEILKENLNDLEVTVTPEMEENLKNAMKGGKLKDFLKTLNIKWRLQDNSVTDITLGGTNQVYLKWLSKYITSQNKYTKITLEIEKAETVKELEEIKWS
jgi:putative uncharacterized protein FNV0807